MNQKTKSGLKIISKNRKAGFNYFFEDFFEAGIVLKGSEVKSLRDGKANISESYAFDENGEIAKSGKVNDLILNQAIDNFSITKYGKSY